MQGITKHIERKRFGLMKPKLA